MAKKWTKMRIINELVDGVEPYPGTIVKHYLANSDVEHCLHGYMLLYIQITLSKTNMQQILLPSYEEVGRTQYFCFVENFMYQVYQHVPAGLLIQSIFL